MKKMSEIATEQLQRVLEVAVLAPGNRSRFLAAGLVISDPNTTALELVEDWEEAFCHLSILSKEEVRANPGQFLATAEDIVYRGNSSGTKGNHFIYFAGTEWNKARLQARYRSLAWWGIDDTVPIVNVASHLFPLRLNDTTIVGKLNSAMIQGLVEQLSNQYSAIRGYPSRLCEVATLLKGQVIPRIIAVICTGECLFDFQKILLEQVFSAPVIDEYGCQETGISALTCPEVGRLHLDTNRCLYEIVDDHLVATDLFNFVMPLVRYQCGDVLKIDPEPCPCGRSEPTAKLLGRQEDWIRTVQGRQRPGSIVMPAFDGVLHYQIVREVHDQISIRISRDQKDLTISLEAMASWVEATFGPVDVQVLLETSSDKVSSDNPECDENSWMQGITQGAWSECLRQPALPKGELRYPAQLLKALVMPEFITYNNLTATTHRLFHTVLHQASTQSPIIELMTIRILFFACSYLANGTEVRLIYSQVLERFRRLLDTHPDLVGAAILDAFIPTLSLPVDVGRAIWQDSINYGFNKTHGQPDNFTIQHLLHAFEPAVQQANSTKNSSFLPALRPLIAILIGDLEWIAKNLRLEYISHWFDLLHGTQTTIKFEPPKDEFSRTWLRWRHKLVCCSDDRYQSLQMLSAIASSPQEKARVILERGYNLLMEEVFLEPTEWLSLLQSTIQSRAVTPIAWAPILRSLAISLLKQGEHQLAYECLQTATVPSAKVSAFGRQLQLSYNSKQMILLDLDA
jgi:phenylacetate-coenzyme A ligase PaaK-like adenylate-forming protein